MFKPIPKSDVNIRPLKVFKTWALDNSTVGYNVIRNLTGSFTNYENVTIINSLGEEFNEYSLNKSIRSLYYNNVPKLIGNVYNWDYYKHTTNTQYIYQVTSSAGLITYRNYFDTNTRNYVNEFEKYLVTNEYRVNNKGEIINGPYTDITKIYGVMKNYSSPYERIIENRYFVIQIPQKYIGESIQPGSITLYDNFTNKTIIDDSYGNLVYNNNTSSIVGNSFYANGILVITQKTQNITDELYNFGTNNFTLKFNSTKTIYENEIFLEVLPNEFNISTNPTAVKVYNGAPYIRSRFQINGQDYDFRIVSEYNKESKIGFSDYNYSSSIDPTGSYLAPYITTIGLYDDFFNLVAVAKIPSKPKSTPDYPINFVVRFDT